MRRAILVAVLAVGCCKTTSSETPTPTDIDDARVRSQRGSS